MKGKQRGDKWRREVDWKNKGVGWIIRVEGLLDERRNATPPPGWKKGS